MPIPQNKDELLKSIQDHFQKLSTELRTIDYTKVHSLTLAGHAQNTHMSIHNLISYLVGWGQLVLKWNSHHLKNIPVDFPETGFRWNELGLLAQKFYKDYEDIDYQELVTKFEKTTQEILELIHQKTNHELYEVSWYQQWTLGRMIQLNTAAPFKNAHARIRKWKKLQATQ
jgi:hypothetical protein